MIYIKSLEISPRKTTEKKKETKGQIHFEEDSMVYEFISVDFALKTKKKIKRNK